MIGGLDITVELGDLSPTVAMPSAVRYVLDRWPSAVLQDGDTARRFPNFAAMDFVQLREVFVYRDEESFDSWQRLGADATNANRMIHLVGDSDRLTIVVDSLQDIETASIVRGLRDRLRRGMPYLVLSSDDSEAA